MTAESTAPQSTDTVNVPNPGGPRIPGASLPPNTQGVSQPDPKPVQENKPETESGEDKSQNLDLDALKQLLGPKSDTETKTEANPDPESLETGNAIIDAGVAMLQKVAGLNNDDIMRAMGNAVKFNNPELIDSAFLKERFKEHAEYAELLCKAYYEDRVGQAQSLVKSAYEAAGGEEQWGVARDVFKSKAPAHLQTAARTLIDAGNVKDGVALIMDYCRTQGLVVQQGNQIKGSAGLAGAPLTSSEFSAEYRKLREEAGNRSLESGPLRQRYDDLLARREAGKRLGR